MTSFLGKRQVFLIKTSIMNGKFTKNLLTFIFVFSLGSLMNSSVVSAQICDVPVGLNTSNVSNFSYAPEKELKDKIICVKGKVTENKGTPTMSVSNEKSIEIISN